MSTANTGPISTTISCNSAAGDSDTDAVTATAATDTCSKYSSVGYNRTIANGNIAAVTAIATADTSSKAVTTIGYDRAAIDSDRTARTITATADTSSVYTALCRNCTITDYDIATGTKIAAADTRSAKWAASSCDCATANNNVTTITDISTANTCTILASARSCDCAIADSNFASVAVIATADAGRIRATRSCDGTSRYSDVTAVSFTSSSDTCSCVTSIGRDCTATDSNTAAIANVRIICTSYASTYTGSKSSTVSIHSATIDGDYTRITIFTAADSRATNATGGHDHTAIDSNISTVTGIATDTSNHSRNISLLSGNQCAHIFAFTLGIDSQAVVPLYRNTFTDSEYCTIRKNQVYFTIDHCTP